MHTSTRSSVAEARKVRPCDSPGFPTKKAGGYPVQGKLAQYITGNVALQSLHNCRFSGFL